MVWWFGWLGWLVGNPERPHLRPIHSQHCIKAYILLLNTWATRLINSSFFVVSLFSSLFDYNETNSCPTLPTCLCLILDQYCCIVVEYFSSPQRHVCIVVSFVFLRWMVMAIARWRAPVSKIPKHDHSAITYTLVQKHSKHDYDTKSYPLPTPSTYILWIAATIIYLHWMKCRESLYCTKAAGMYPDIFSFPTSRYCSGQWR